jgi:hypothetical protein
MALAVLAQALLRRGAKSEGLLRAKEAIDLLRSLGALEEGEALVRLTFAEALAATGDDAARSVALEARDALLVRAEKIDDPALRKTFLEDVDENRATLKLAERD